MWQQYYKATRGSVKAYHVTSKDNVESILENGITAQACKATTRGDYRQDAVYLFAVRQDAYDSQLHKFLFDDYDNVAVIEVTIPEDFHHLLQEDGLFNMSAICGDGSYPTAMQYFDSIPVSWIEVRQ